MTLLGVLAILARSLLSGPLGMGYRPASVAPGDWTSNRCLTQRRCSIGRPAVEKTVFCKCSNRWRLSTSPDSCCNVFFFLHLPFPVTLASCSFSFPKTFPMLFPLPEAHPPRPCLYSTFPANDYMSFLSPKTHFIKEPIP